MKVAVKSSLGLAPLALSPALLGAQEHAPHASPHWSYHGATGPQHWGDLEPNYSACKTGARQSPINIQNAERTSLPTIEFDYHAAPLTTLWDHLPSEVEHEQKVANVQVNAADLLPKQTGYYAFEGSLTTPPCTEGVRWMVLSQPEEISPGELHTFSGIYANNARPIQLSNDRVVKESK